MGGRTDGQGKGKGEQRSDKEEFEAFPGHLTSPFRVLRAKTRGPPDATLMTSGSEDVRLWLNLRDLAHDQTCLRPCCGFVVLTSFSIDRLEAMPHLANGGREASPSDSLVYCLVYKKCFGILV